MRRTRTVSCALLMFLLLALSGCEPRQAAHERQALSADTVRFARNLRIECFDDYVSVHIRDPWDTLRPRQHYVLVDRDKPLPSRLPAELIANGALARFFSTETVTFDLASRRLVARPK